MRLVETAREAGSLKLGTVAVDETKVTASVSKAIVEPVAGWIKEILGFRRFSLRGLERVQGEWNLVCAAVNLKRLPAQMCWEKGDTTS